MHRSGPGQSLEVKRKLGGGGGNSRKETPFGWKSLLSTTYHCRVGGHANAIRGIHKVCTLQRARGGHEKADEVREVVSIFLV